MTKPAETWQHTLDRAAGLIAAVELDHPRNKKLKKAALPFLEYVNGLGTDGDKAAAWDEGYRAAKYDESVVLPTSPTKHHVSANPYKQGDN